MPNGTQEKIFEGSDRCDGLTYLGVVMCFVGYAPTYIAAPNSVLALALALAFQRHHLLGERSVTMYSRGASCENDVGSGKCCPGVVGGPELCLSFA